MSGFSHDLGFAHRFVVGEQDARPLLLLHGTGGDEADLLPLGQAIAPGSPLLSPRGKVSENGMARFFRRHAEGVLDAEDLQARAMELAAFVRAAFARYGLDAGRAVAVGFSNGANMGAGLLMTGTGVVGAAVLLRPMALPLDPVPEASAVPVLILSGGDDPIAPPDSAERLAHQLRVAGATVTLEKLAGVAHGLTRAELPMMQAWLASLDPATELMG